MNVDLAKTMGAALRAGTAELAAAGSPSPRLDAEVLLAHAVGRERTWLLAHPDEELNPEVATSFEASVARRATGEPVAYIRGFKEWRSLRIRTDARALIPRPETELLLDVAIEEIERRLEAAERVVAWEVATGSGAVSVALALQFLEPIGAGRLLLIASDVSPDALSLAGENLEAHGVAEAVDLVEADLLAPAARDLPLPDVVVANLPYVATSEVEAAGGSLKHEPRLALDGGVDGLDLIRRLLDEVGSRATPGAAVLLEIGAGQAEAVRALAPEGASVSLHADLAGIDRVVRIRLPD